MKQKNILRNMTFSNYDIHVNLICTTLKFLNVQDIQAYCIYWN